MSDTRRRTHRNQQKTGRLLLLFPSKSYSDPHAVTIITLLKVLSILFLSVMAIILISISLSLDPDTFEDMMIPIIDRMEKDIGGDEPWFSVPIRECMDKCRNLLKTGDADIVTLCLSTCQTLSTNLIQEKTEQVRIMRQEQHELTRKLLDIKEKKRRDEEAEREAEEDEDNDDDCGEEEEDDESNYSDEL